MEGKMQHANDNHTGLRFLSVCSGIEAASVAWHPLGWQCIGVAEIEPFPAFVLAHHYGAGRPKYMPNPGEPGIKLKDQRSRKTALKAVSRLPVESVLTNWGDFTKIDTKALGRVDILAGGTPCQAFSVAGLRQSLADARGNLSLEFVRLAHELAANNGLRNVVWENVVGVLSTKDNAFGCFLAGLVGADSPIEPPRRGKWARHGMVSGPKGRAAWAVKDGQFFGVAQRRRRVLVVADFGNGADPAAVLFEPESMFRDTPPSRETGKSITHPVAPSLVSSGRGIERTGDTRGQDPVVAVLRGHSDYGPGLPSVRANGGDCAGGSEALVFAPEIARCVATREGSSQDYETTTMVAVAGTLCKDSFSGGMGGRPEGAAAGHFIAHAIQAGALRTNPSSGPDGVGVQEGVAYTLEARAEVQAVCVTGDVAHTLKAEGADASEDGTGRGTPIIAFDHNKSANDNSSLGFFEESTGCLKASQKATFSVAGQFLVRRLTPTECEKLQGFEPGYTEIPWRGKPAELCPDGPRYKALGNSWAVPKFVWLGRRINALMPANDNTDRSPMKDAA